MHFELDTVWLFCALRPLFAVDYCFLLFFACAIIAVISVTRPEGADGFQHRLRRRVPLSGEEM